MSKANKLEHPRLHRREERGWEEVGCEKGVDGLREWGGGVVVVQTACRDGQWIREGHLAPQSRVNGMWLGSMQYTLASDGGHIIVCALPNCTFYTEHT